MPAPPLPPDLVTHLPRLNPNVRALLVRAREFVWRFGRPKTECVFDANYALSIGYGESVNMGDWGVYTAAYSKHVNIGFIYGAMLADPAGILRGAGKQMRHVQIKTSADLDAPALQTLVKTAIAARKTAKRAMRATRAASRPKPKPRAHPRAKRRAKP